MSKKDTVSVPPGLEDISNLFPPSAPASPSPVANVSMKLPAFWPDMMREEVWFTQVDGQFAIHNISVSKTKFYHAVAVLPQEVALQILDLIHAPLARDPFEVLPECLIMLYTERLSAFQGSGLSSSLW